MAAAAFYIFVRNTQNNALYNFRGSTSYATREAALAEFNRYATNLPGYETLFAAAPSPHIPLVTTGWDYRNRRPGPPSYTATLKPGLPESADLALLSSYTIRPVNLHAPALANHAHDQVRAETSLLKDISTALDTEGAILLREKRDLARRKAIHQHQLSALGETLSQHARDLASAIAAATADTTTINANITQVEKRQRTLAEKLWPACFADAIIAGLGVAWEDNFNPEPTPGTGGEYAHNILMQSARALADALTAKWQGLDPIPPYARAADASKELVKKLKADAALETYADNGTRTTDDSTRFLGRGYKVVETLSTPAVATEALAATLVEAAWTASEPSTEG